MERKQLAQRWANTLINTLHRDYNIGVVQPIRTVPSPRLITFVLKLVDSRHLSKALRIEEELSLKLGSKSTRVFRDYGSVIIEVPLPESLCKTLSADKLNQKGGLWVTLGLTSQMTPVHCRLNSPSIAPILIAGRTGAGKTEALRLMMWELLSNQKPDELKIVLYDPKSKFPELHNSAHLLIPPLITNQDTISGMGYLTNELNNRMANNNNSPRILFVIDEMILLMDIDKVMSDVIGRLTAIGREKNIHTIMATQRPDRANLDKLGAANIGLRLVGTVSDTIEAKVATGLAGTGAHLLNGKGDMLACLGGAIHRYQGGFVKPSQFDVLPKAKLDLDHSFSLSNLKTYMSNDLPSGTDMPFSPREMAIALTGMGIGRLKKQLKMGQIKATELRNYAKAILSEQTRL